MANKAFRSSCNNKNFQIPKQYGFTKPDLILEFHPFYYFTSKYISQYRKILYLVCEQLNEEEQKIFLEYIRKDFIKRGLKFNEYSYMEMYLSYFLKVDYISHTNMKNCSKIFKVMGFEDVCDWMNTLYVEGNEPTKVKVSYNNMKEHKLKDEKQI
ncbi:hypothetical protein HHI36_005460 [Cryptolaemus montrouzieri]|uniref:Caspase-8 second domain-containing protein n=1 Tax=Cryptolaemus montrouzieri TaxID=559131 RepID=A0ABD2NUH6_9CUCU